MVKQDVLLIGGPYDGDTVEITDIESAIQCLELFHGTEEAISYELLTLHLFTGLCIYKHSEITQSQALRRLLDGYSYDVAERNEHIRQTEINKQEHKAGPQL
jgi:hypothetical protein